MSDLTKFLIKAYVRKALAMLGTFLITHGVLKPDESEGFIAAYLEEAVGALLIGGSAVWTAAYQWYVKRKVLKAKQMPPSATSEQLEEALQKDAA